MNSTRLGISQNARIDAAIDNGAPRRKVDRRQSVRGGTGGAEEVIGRPNTNPRLVKIKFMSGISAIINLLTALLSYQVVRFFVFTLWLDDKRNEVALFSRSAVGVSCLIVFVSVLSLGADIYLLSKRNNIQETLLAVKYWIYSKFVLIPVSSVHLFFLFFGLIGKEHYPLVHHNENITGQYAPLYNFVIATFSLGLLFTFGHIFLFYNIRTIRNQLLIQDRENRTMVMVPPNDQIPLLTIPQERVRAITTIDQDAIDTASENYYSRMSNAHPPLISQDEV